ncbi:hypothetical protein V8C44DRAFT_367126 [Trichoderma aethiopicum]
MSGGRIVVYLLRRDLRTADNPILHHLSRTGGKHGYTHLLPVYVLPPDQIEVSGLVKDGETSPYPCSLAEVSRYWKCGIHRVRFLAESIWDLKSKLETLGSGLIIRAGSFPDVLGSIVEHYANHEEGPQVAAVWMTKGFLQEEVNEQQAIASFCDEARIRFTLFRDNRWFINDTELSARSIIELPNKFSEFQTRIGRVEDQPRRVFHPPLPLSLPPFPDRASLPAQKHPFEMPDTLSKLVEKMSKQVKPSTAFFEFAGVRGFTPAIHPSGGETLARTRLRDAIKNGSVSQYDTTVDDLQVEEESFHMTAYLSLGCISARQVHEELVRLEQGTEPEYAEAPGFGEGENPGTRALRTAMLHIDFIWLSNRKCGRSVYSLEGSGPGRNPGIHYKTPNRNEARPGQVPCPLGIESILVQFQVGATGFGLIDAIMRQLLSTGYISARSQMLAANFLGKFAGVDWRFGVEWVASLSIEHDTSLHWYRWQHHIGIGPDPTGGEVTLSPAHAALEFDPDGAFVRKWMPELRRLTALPDLFKVATTSPELLQLLGLATSVMVTRPVPSNAVNCQRSDHRRTARAMAEMIPLQAAEASSHPGTNGESLLSARAFPTAHDIAPSGPATVNPASTIHHDAANSPTAVASTPRQPAIVVSDPRALAAATALREAHNSPAAMASIPRGPRAQQAGEASQVGADIRHVAQILQHPRTAQRPSVVAQEFRGSSQALLNAPRGPRADYRPFQAQSNAPPNAPRGPRADYRPFEPPRNAPQAPRGQPWQYQNPLSNPQAHRAANWQPPSRPNVFPENGLTSRNPLGDPQAHRAANWQHPSRPNGFPENVSTSQTPQNRFSALQTAPRGPRAMQTLPPGPPWAPQMAEPFVGPPHPTTYPYNLYTNPPCPTFYGPYAFGRPTNYQYMEDLAYHEVLQDYYQWHASGPGNGGPPNAAPPETDDVVRHGMILRFLDSLPPPPSNPQFPPNPPQLYLKARHRRRNRTRSSRGSGATAQTGSTQGTTAITRPVVPSASADVTPRVAQREPYRREISAETVVVGTAQVAESADVDNAVETPENGQDNGEGKKCDECEDCKECNEECDNDEEADDDCASAATCMW